MQIEFNQMEEIRTVECKVLKVSVLFIEVMIVYHVSVFM